MLEINSVPNKVTKFLAAVDPVVKQSLETDHFTLLTGSYSIYILLSNVATV